MVKVTKMLNLALIKTTLKGLGRIRIRKKNSVPDLTVSVSATLLVRYRTYHTEVCVKKELANESNSLTVGTNSCYKN